MEREDKLMEAPEPEVLVGPDGREHLMRYRLWRSPDGIEAEAMEEGAEGGGGYRFEVFGEEIGGLLDQLRERVRDGIGRLYLEPDEEGVGWTLRDTEVQGRFVSSGSGSPHDVVVDGRRLSWRDLGELLEPFEGVEFRLRVGDSEGDDLDEETEAFLEAYEQAQADAIDFLREALADIRHQPPPPELTGAAARLRQGIAKEGVPYEAMRLGAGWLDDLPADDIELWLGAAGGLIALREKTSLELDEEANLIAMQPADWVGAVIGLVRAGVGAAAGPEDLVKYLEALPETEGQIEPDDMNLVESAFRTILSAWEVAEAVDSEGKLTALGHWGLPRALAWAWERAFDS